MMVPQCVSRCSLYLFLSCSDLSIRFLCVSVLMFMCGVYVNFWCVCVWVCLCVYVILSINGVDHTFQAAFIGRMPRILAACVHTNTLLMLLLHPV
jgi:hypothetical protein